MITYPLFRTLATLVTVTQPQLSDVDAISGRVSDDDDFDRRRDERWVYRWQNGYTEDTPVTRHNVELAAHRLGVSLTTL